MCFDLGVMLCRVFLCVFCCCCCCRVEGFAEINGSFRIICEGFREILEKSISHFAFPEEDWLDVDVKSITPQS